MNIYVIRHGLTQLNKEKKVNAEIDEPLAPEGIKQTKEIIPLLPKTISCIYTSPLKRTRQTTDIIHETLPIPTFIQNELTEIHMGSLAGKSWEEMDGGEELKKKHRAVQFDYRLYGGESLGQVKERILSFLSFINNKYQDDQVLCITHGGIIRLMKFLQNGFVTDETEKNVTLLTFDLDTILNNS